MEFVSKSEMKRFSTQTLGRWVELKDGSQVIHIENDLPIVRVFDPVKKEVLTIGIKEFDKVLNEVRVPNALGNTVQTSN